jgi:hypothetical protein
MSHVTTIAVEIRDLAAVKEICAELGLEFHQNQKTYRWYGRHVGDYPLPAGFTKADLGRCDHAIGVKGGSSQSYEIGLVKRGDQHVVLWDFWQGGYGLEACVGKNGQKFVTAYTKAVATKTAKEFARAKGFSYTQKVDPETNEVVLLLRKYS